MTKDPLRILIFAHDSLLYGASKSLLTLLEEWKIRKNVIVKVLLPYPGKMEEKLDEMGVEYEIIGYPRCIYQFRKQAFIERIKIKLRYIAAQKKVAAQLSKSIKKFRPQVFYSNTSVIKIGYDFSKLHQLPHVWHIREFGWEDYQLKYIPGKSSIKKKISNSESIFISEVLHRYWLGTKTGKSRVIYNGLLEDDFKPAPKKLMSNPVNIILLGAIMPGKGQATAIQAMSILSKNFSNLRLQLYGDMFDKAYYDKIALLIRELNLGNIVSINGFNDEVEKLYSETDILINCSESEGFGRTIVEAMGRGIPVVANNAGGIPEIIEHGIDGLLYNKTPEDLAKQLGLLISDNSLFEKIAANAIRKAQTKFTTKQYSNAVYDVLEKAVSNWNYKQQRSATL